MSDNRQMKRIGELSQRYVSRGDGRDYDEFRGELRRVEIKQRHQLLERYIRDLQARYPYRHIRYDPARQERVTRLVDRAIAEQQAANATLQLQNDKLRDQLDSVEEQSLITAADTLMQQAEKQKEETPFLTQAAAYLPILLMVVGVLLLVLVVTLVYAIVKVTAAAAAPVVELPSGTAEKAAASNAA